MKVYKNSDGTYESRNGSSREIYSLIFDNEKGYSIATDREYEGHESGSDYEDLGHISKAKANKCFSDFIKEKKDA